LCAVPSPSPASELAYHPILLGVINLSPESMVKGSVVAGPEGALERARQLREQGVAWLDRSITPNVPELSDADEQARLAAVLPALEREGFRLSVDTWSPDTAVRALAWGARLVNYTRSELPDELLGAVASAGASLCITYMPYGDAYRMRGAERVPYRVESIVEFLSPRVERARSAGVPEVIVDPNLGIIHPATDDYAKAHLQLEVLGELDRVRALGCPILLYAARKPERLARILIAEAVLRARPEYVRTHEPETIERLLAAARETAHE
jgi:dihydropteroate synthase